MYGERILLVNYSLGFRVWGLEYLAKKGFAGGFRGDACFVQLSDSLFNTILDNEPVTRKPQTKP